MTEPIDIIGLGAGVQSSTMALRAALGEITPMPIGAVFADTMAEPKNVYLWLDWLEKQLPFPIYRVSRGSLLKRCLSPYKSKINGKMTFESIPAFMDGGQSIIPRQCTRDFKVDPVTKEINRLRRENSNRPAIQWIGISSDEIWRAKEHRNFPRISNRFPLIEARMTRSDCLAWMKRRGFPKPPRSACVFCPYRSNSEWRALKQDDPDGFTIAVHFEKQFQKTTNGILENTPFLHRSCKPLSEVDFSTEEERGQLNMFNNECEGMCGV